MRRYLLTGLMICGRCGGPLRGRRVYPKGEGRGPLSYSCAQCHRMSVYAHHVEPLILEALVERLEDPNAARLAEAERDGAEAETLRLQANTLTAELDALAMERAEGLLTARQVQIATGVIQNKLAAIRSRQIDGTRARVLDGLPLGRPGVADALDRAVAGPAARPDQSADDDHRGAGRQERACVQAGARADHMEVDRRLRTRDSRRPPRRGGPLCLAAPPPPEYRALGDADSWAQR